MISPYGSYMQSVSPAGSPAFMKEVLMKRIPLIALILSVLVLLFGCSWPAPLPDEGTFYNEELDIVLVFTPPPINGLDVIWKSKQDCLYAWLGIGFGRGVLFYACDENEDHIDLLVGEFWYSDDTIVITASQIAQPFDIDGELTDVDDLTFVFRRKDL